MRRQHTLFHDRYCNCASGFVDEAKPTNTKIHINAIGVFNSQRGCTHQCRAAQPASLLCYCVSHPGTPGCIDTGAVASPGPTTSPSSTQAGNTQAPTTTDAPVTMPPTRTQTSFAGDICSVIDPNSRVSTSKTNYCECGVGRVDGAKPTNTFIHVNAIGTFNVQRNCTHRCDPATPRSQLCYCLANPSSAGCL